MGSIMQKGPLKGYRNFPVILQKKKNARSAPRLVYLISSIFKNNQATCQGCHFCKVSGRPSGPFGCPLRIF